MAATPETLRPEVPQIKEINNEAEFPAEKLQNAGVQVQQVVKTFKAQVKDDKGQPVIQTPPTQVITVTPPADDTTLTTWSKGSISSSLTWLGAFWIRVVKKAFHLGWKVEGNDQQNVS
jgi:hypothetical protein